MSTITKLRDGRTVVSEANNARITIYVPAELDAAIRRAADAAGQSLSIWLARAARAALREQEAGR